MLSVSFFIVILVRLIIILSGVSYLIGEASYYLNVREEDSSYECGFEHHSLSRLPFSLRYFVLTLFFIKLIALFVFLYVFLFWDLAGPHFGMEGDLSVWAQCGLQEGISVVIQSMIIFYDHMVILVCVVVAFVTYLFFLHYCRCLLSCIVSFLVWLESYTMTFGLSLDLYKNLLFAFFGLLISGYIIWCFLSFTPVLHHAIPPSPPDKIQAVIDQALAIAVLSEDPQEINAALNLVKRGLETLREFYSINGMGSLNAPLDATIDSLNATMDLLNASSSISDSHKSPPSDGPGRGS